MARERFGAVLAGTDRDRPSVRARFGRSEWWEARATSRARATIGHRAPPPGRRARREPGGRRRRRAPPHRSPTSAGWWHRCARRRRRPPRCCRGGQVQHRRLRGTGAADRQGQEAGHDRCRLRLRATRWASAVLPSSQTALDRLELGRRSVLVCRRLLAQLLRGPAARLDQHVAMAGDGSAPAGQVMRSFPHDGSRGGPHALLHRAAKQRRRTARRRCCQNGLTPNASDKGRGSRGRGRRARSAAPRPTSGHRRDGGPPGRAAAHKSRSSPWHARTGPSGSPVASRSGRSSAARA